MATVPSAGDQGFVSRALAAVRYAVTGQLPGWFGPGNPLPPQAPESVRGRGLDFPVAININYRPRGTEPVNFDRLKQLAKNPIIAMLLQRQKDLVCGNEWSIKPRTKVNPDAAQDPFIGTLINFFHEPDREHDWAQWISALLDQLMVIDAVSIYCRPTRGGGLYSCELIDGSTIKPLLNELGRRPVPPDAAYQQVLKGMPAENYTSDELIYFPQTYRVDRIYGYSRLEQAIDLVEQSIARLRSQLGYWTHGNLGDGYFEAPDGWTPDDVATLEQRWNQMMTGSIEGRRATPFVPHGTVFHETKGNLIADAYDEFLIRLLCFPFGVAPQPFMKQTGLGHGSAGTDKQAAEEGGIEPLLQYITRLINRIIDKKFGRPDLEFSWLQDREIDPNIASEIDDRELQNGSTSINEVRDRKGKPPVDGGDEPMVYLPTGPVLVRDIQQAAEDAAAARQKLLESPAPKPGEPIGISGDEPQKTESTEPLAKADQKAEKRLAKALKAYLARKADEVANAVTASLGKAAMDDQSGPINKALDDIDWSWSDLSAVVEPLIAGIAVAAGTDALSELNLFDAATLKRMSAKSTEYAQSRAAELVGMKLVDGELVDNPDAAWSIAETTRTLIRNVVTNALEEGASNDTLATSVREAGAFSQARADMIARTETATADVQGTIAGWKASGVVAGKQWLVADGCCDECGALDGEVVGIDEDFDDGDPPLHPNCLPGDTLVLAKGVTSTFERPYDGNVVVISTASGKRLTCTPNHPVLTLQGWIAASRLDVGGNVISSRLGDGALGAAQNAENMPARIEDVAKTFGRSGKMTAVPVPVSAPDFHGDGEGSEIAIVRTNRLLVDDTDATSCKRYGKPLFFRGDVEAPEHHSAGVLDLGLDGNDATGASTVGALDLLTSRGRIHIRPSVQTSSAVPAANDIVITQDASDNIAADAELSGNSLFGHSALVEPAYFGFVDDGTGPNLDPRLLQLTADGRHGNTGLAADISDVLAGGVFVDAIVNIQLRRFAGHVFNLETKAGLYIAEGIVTHNCECSIVAVLPEDMPDADSGDEDQGE